MTGDVVAVIAVAAQLSMGAVFLWAAAAKMLAVRQLRESVAQMGMSSTLARAGAPLLVGAEFATGAGLVIFPVSWLPRASMVVLATAFALAGVFAVRTGRQVHCRCFGTAGGHLLGWRQVRLWPLWVGLAAVAQWAPPGWAWRDGLLFLAFVLLAMTLVRIPGQLRVLRRLQGDRIALSPTYRGLPDEGEVTA